MRFNGRCHSSVIPGIYVLNLDVAKDENAGSRENGHCEQCSCEKQFFHDEERETSFSRMMAISREVPMNVRGRIRKPPLAASWSSFCIVEVFVVASSLYRARSGPCDLSRSTAS